MNGNLFNGLPSQLPAEIFDTLLDHGQLRIERILSHGQTSPPDFWYDQPQHEWLILLQGAARLRFADQSTQDLHPGDYCLIPAHCRHRVDWTAQDTVTIWLAIHFTDS